MGIDNICMLFRADKKLGTYTYHAKVNNLEPEFLNTPCFFVYGAAVYQRKNEIETKEDYIDRFNQVGVVDIILANMAAHPQYNGVKLHKYKNNPYEVLQEKNICHSLFAPLKQRFADKLQLSIQHGCRENDARLLFIRHIMCELPKTQLELV